METKRLVMSAFVLAFLALSVLPFASAGVGIKWNVESALIPENSHVCLTYGLYNPWPKDAYVSIQLSESLQNISKKNDSQIEFIPRDTSSNDSIPVQFCFDTPKVYHEDCLLWNTFLCSQSCSESMKIYSGEVEIKEVSGAQVSAGGAGGSSTAMSVGAPLAIKVQCNAHGTDYSIIYLLVGIIALVILLWRVYKRNKKKSKLLVKSKVKSKFRK